MLRAARSLVRLTRAARVLGKHDALFPLELRAEMPAILLALMPVSYTHPTLPTIYSV